MLPLIVLPLQTSAMQLSPQLSADLSPGEISKSLPPNSPQILSGPLDWLNAILATSLAFYRSQKGLSLKNSEKNPERGSQGLSAPGSKKPEKESKMTIFPVFFGFLALFQLFFDFFLASSTFF